MFDCNKYRTVQYYELNNIRTNALVVKRIVLICRITKRRLKIAALYISTSVLLKQSEFQSNTNRGNILVDVLVECNFRSWLCRSYSSKLGYNSMTRSHEI